MFEGPTWGALSLDDGALPSSGLMATLSRCGCLQKAGRQRRHPLAILGHSHRAGQARLWLQSFIVLVLVACRWPATHFGGLGSAQLCGRS